MLSRVLARGEPVTARIGSAHAPQETPCAMPDMRRADADLRADQPEVHAPATESQATAVIRDAIVIIVLAAGWIVLCMYTVGPF